jgi:hypothetical protein
MTTTIAAGVRVAWRSRAVGWERDGGLYGCVKEGCMIYGTAVGIDISRSPVKSVGDENLITTEKFCVCYSLALALRS